MDAINCEIACRSFLRRGKGIIPQYKERMTFYLSGKPTSAVPLELFNIFLCCISACAGIALKIGGCSRHQLRVTLVERREIEDKKDVGLNPELEAADGEQDAFRLLPTCAPILFEASDQRRFLLSKLEFGQQEGMANADLLPVEGFDHYGCNLGQLQTTGDIGRTLPGTCGDLLDGVFRFFQIEKSAKALRFLHRVHVTAHEIFDLSLVVQKLSMTSTTMESCTL